MGSAEVQIRGAKTTIQGQVNIRPLNSSTDSVSVINSPTNPINDFNQAIGVGRLSSSTHTYTATGNFKLSSVEASASGSMKVEVKAGNSGVETTRMAAFTSPSNPIIQLIFHEELQLTISQRILVIRTNRENVAMDLFSTILGFNT